MQAFFNLFIRLLLTRYGDVVVSAVRTGGSDGGNGVGDGEGIRVRADAVLDAAVAALLTDAR
jgi:hypothetical protein